MKYINFQSAKSRFQNIIGLGFHLNVLSNLYLNSNLGAGITKNMEKNYAGIPERYNDFTPLVTIGIGYNF